MTYATVNDVAVLLARTMTAGEEAKAAFLLPIADAKILAAVPTVAARLTAGTLDAALATYVAASMVARALTTSDGVTSTEVSIDDYRQVERREAARAEGGFSLTEDEFSLLQPADETSTGGAFTVKPYAIPRQRSVDCRW